MSEVQDELQREQEGSTQQKEQQVLEKAGIKFEDNTYKINLAENAVQEQSTDEIPVRDKPEAGQEVVEEVRSPEKPAEEKEQVLELITEEDELYSKESKSNEEQAVQAETSVKQEEEIILPENIQSLVNFMQETGGSIEDYVRLNADYSKVNELTLLKEYYRQTKTHLDNDEIDFLIEDSFGYDEELDEKTDIKRKTLAYKEEITKARKFLSDIKDKYYQEIKSSPRFSQEQREAIEFYNQYKKQQAELTAEQQRQSEQFTKMTNQVFNEEFKGFDFKVGDNKYRFKVNDVQQTKQIQSNIVDSFRMFLDENNTIKDAQGYHKALFAARNADTIASHFYEQGKADAIRQLEAQSKNINMDPRKTSNGVIETGGLKIRAISGDDSSKLRVKIRN